MADELKDKVTEKKYKVPKKKATIKVDDTVVGTTTVSVQKSSKDEEARLKVQELLKGTSVAPLVGLEVPKEVEEVSASDHQQEKNQQWLENQLEIMSHQMEKLQNEVHHYRNLAQQPVNRPLGGAPLPPLAPGEELLTPNAPVQGNMRESIIRLFKHFEDLHLKYNHDGSFSVKVTYPQSGNGILEKFVEYFPFLNEYKRYHSMR